MEAPCAESCNTSWEKRPPPSFLFLMMRSESGNWAGKRWEIDYIFFDRQTDEQHTFLCLSISKKRLDTASDTGAVWGLTFLGLKKGRKDPPRRTLNISAFSSLNKGGDMQNNPSVPYCWQKTRTVGKQRILGCCL